MSVLEEIEKLTQPVFQLPDLEDEDFDGLLGTRRVQIPPFYIAFSQGPLQKQFIHKVLMTKTLPQDWCGVSSN